MGLTASHEDALRALQAVDLCAQVIGSLVVAPGVPCPCAYCALRRVDASYLDAVSVDVESVRQAGFASETVDVDRWDAVLDLPAAPALPLAQRRARIIAARSQQGGLSKAHFIALATSMGYTITIDRGVMPLRAGIAAVGDVLVSVNRLTTANPLDLFDLRNHLPYPVELTPTAVGSLGAESAAARVTNPPYPSDFWTWVVTINSLGSNLDSTLLKARFEALKPAYSTIVWKRFYLDGLVGSLAGVTRRQIDGQVGSIASITMPHYDPDLETTP